MSPNRLIFHNQDINNNKNINLFFGDARIFDDSGFYIIDLRYQSRKIILIQKLNLTKKMDLSILLNTDVLLFLQLFVLTKKFFQKLISLTLIINLFLTTSFS